MSAMPCCFSKRGNCRPISHASSLRRRSGRWRRIHLHVRLSIIRVSKSTSNTDSRPPRRVTRTISPTAQWASGTCRSILSVRHASNSRLRTGGLAHHQPRTVPASQGCRNDDALRLSSFAEVHAHHTAIAAHQARDVQAHHRPVRSQRRGHAPHLEPPPCDNNRLDGRDDARDLVCRIQSRRKNSGSFAPSTVENNVTSSNFGMDITPTIRACRLHAACAFQFPISCGNSRSQSAAGSRNIICVAMHLEGPAAGQRVRGSWGSPATTGTYDAGLAGEWNVTRLL